MNAPPIPQWSETAPHAAFSAPRDCTERAAKFEKRIRIRNTVEYVAGILVVLMFGAFAIGAALSGELLIALSCSLIVAGTGLIMWNLRRRASNLDRRPEDPCIVHLRRQYRRQYEALRDVPKWYIAPLLPGVLLFYVIVTAKVADRIGWHRALEGIVGPALVTFGIFALVALANWWGARSLKRRVDALDMLA